jgi:hypothetical protein
VKRISREWRRDTAIIRCRDGKKNAMSTNSLETLLLGLAAEPDDAAEAYGIVHARLTRFFNLKNMADPATMADGVMDRLAASMVTRGAAQLESPAAFALGIARHLLQEEWRRLAREKEAIREWTGIVRTEHDDEKELTMALSGRLSSPDGRGKTRNAAGLLWLDGSGKDRTPSPDG